MKDEWIVVWVSEETEIQGRGEPMTKSEAESWAEAMNRQYPNIRHEAKKIEPKGESDVQQS